MGTIALGGRRVQGFALGDTPASAATPASTPPPSSSGYGVVACSPPLLTMVMTGAAVGMFAGYALGAPRWASWTAAIGSALFLVPARAVPTPRILQQGA